MAIHIGSNLILDKQRLEVAHKIGTVRGKGIYLMMAHHYDPLSCARLECRLDPRKLLIITLLELIERSGIDHNKVQRLSLAKSEGLLVIQRREGPTFALLGVINLRLHTSRVVVVPSDYIPLLLKELLGINTLKDGLPFRVICGSYAIKVKVVSNRASETGFGP